MSTVNKDDLTIRQGNKPWILELPGELQDSFFFNPPYSFVVFRNDLIHYLSEKYVGELVNEETLYRVKLSTIKFIEERLAEGKMRRT